MFRADTQAHRPGIVLTEQGQIKAEYCFLID
jgi:hypothetical protein